jgi:hypothetical protein
VLLVFLLQLILEVPNDTWVSQPVFSWFFSSRRWWFADIKVAEIQ